MKKNPALYVGDRRYEPDQADAAIAAVHDRAAALEVKPPLHRNVALYVHGRALGGFPLVAKWDKEPEKSQRTVIPELEARYGCAVLMLHWPHKGFGFGFPDDYARAAAPALGATIDALLRHRAANPAAAAIPLTLLAHSMGSIVLEQLIQSGYAGRLAEFQALLVSAPASKVQDSAGWLGRLPPGKAFVTLNRHDPVLVGDMLGNLGADELRGLTADGVFYLDTAGQDVGHRYFVFGRTVDPGETLLYERFYRPLLSGLGLDSAAFTRLWPGEPIFTPAAS